MRLSRRRRWRRYSRAEATAAACGPSARGRATEIRSVATGRPVASATEAAAWGLERRITPRSSRQPIASSSGVLPSAPAGGSWARPWWLCAARTWLTNSRMYMPSRSLSGDATGHLRSARGRLDAPVIIGGDPTARSKPMTEPRSSEPKGTAVPGAEAPERTEVATFGAGCFWKPEAHLPRGAGRRRHRRRLRGRSRRQPDLRAGLHRHDRPRRGRPGHLRPRPGHLRGAARPLLGDARSDAGQPPGPRRRRSVPDGDLHPHSRADRPRPRPRRPPSRSATTSRSRRRSSPRPASGWPRATTSATSSSGGRAAV